jgi:hypothetical protein
MVQVHVERTIAAPPERVFDWLLDPANLAVSPVIRKAVWAKDSSDPGVGAVREVTGIGFWLHEQITAHDAFRSYSYTVVGSFPPAQRQAGTVTCTPSNDGTHVECVSAYTLSARGRQGDGGTLRAADPLANFPRDPRRLREGARGLVTAPQDA